MGLPMMKWPRFSMVYGYWSLLLLRRARVIPALSAYGGLGPSVDTQLSCAERVESCPPVKWPQCSNVYGGRNLHTTNSPSFI